MSLGNWRYVGLKLLGAQQYADSNWVRENAKEWKHFGGARTDDNRHCRDIYERKIDTDGDGKNDLLLRKILTEGNKYNGWRHLYVHGYPLLTFKGMKVERQLLLADALSAEYPLVARATEKAKGERCTDAPIQFETSIEYFVVKFPDNIDRVAMIKDGLVSYFQYSK